MDYLLDRFSNILLLETIVSSNPTISLKSTALNFGTLQSITHVKLNVTPSRTTPLIAQQIEIIKASPLHSHN